MSDEQFENCKINSKFLKLIGPADKTKILTHIANHYGTTVAHAEEELTSEGTELVLEYLGGKQRFETNSMFLYFSKQLYSNKG